MSWNEPLFWFLLVISIMIFISGCNIVGGLFGFDTSPSSDSDNDPIESGKKQLFDAVKGSNWLVTFSILPPDVN